MMVRNKQQVARHFSRAAATYDKAASIQQQVLERLLAPLANMTGHWLDIGCGTGAATSILLKKGANQVTGVDLSEGMLEEAKKRNMTQADFLLSDADQIPLRNESAAGVISSLMLQWSEDINPTLSEWHRLLKPQGTLALATLLPGTQKELKQAWQAIDSAVHVNEFLPSSQVTSSLKQAGFLVNRVEQECMKVSFADLPSLLRNLKEIGATNVNAGRKSGLGGRQAITQLAAHYPRDTPSSPFTLSYEVLWVQAKKI